MKRRNFLKNTTAATILPTIFSGISMKAFAGSTLQNNAVMAAGDTDHVLVIIQLSGGNDGLNMVIPINQYALYVNARKEIYIPQNQILPLSGNLTTGLHPSMRGMQSLYNEGKLSIVNAVGYPTPSFSHLRATDIWTSASDHNVVLKTGWAGRYLDIKYPGYPYGYPNAQAPDPIAIQIGTATSQTFEGSALNMGMSFTDPGTFNNFINDVEDNIPNTYAGEELKFLRLVANQTQQYGTVVRNAASKVSAQGNYPSTSLAAQLKIVARLIKGGLGTKLYMVSTDGFDTHDNQLNRQVTLLGGLSDAIKAFMDDCQGLGIADRVVGMTFSEFGRRIGSNTSGGTDHGAASPLFVFGKNVKPGIVGVNPIIPPELSINDNVPFQHDFRSVYATLLKDWLCVSNADLQTIFFKNFQNLPLIANSTCTVSPVAQTAPQLAITENDDQFLTNYPNPFVQTTKISFKTPGGHVTVQVMDTMGRVIKILADKEYAAGTVNLDFDSGGLPTGVYYARLQNGNFSHVLAMLKVR